MQRDIVNRLRLAGYHSGSLYLRWLMDEAAKEIEDARASLESMRAELQRADAVLRDLSTDRESA